MTQKEAYDIARVSGDPGYARIFAILEEEEKQLKADMRSAKGNFEAIHALGKWDGFLFALERFKGIPAEVIQWLRDQGDNLYGG